MLQESWVAKQKSSKNEVSHIMSIREKMAQMTMVVRVSRRCKPHRRAGMTRTRG